MCRVVTPKHFYKYSIGYCSYRVKKRKDSQIVKFFFFLRKGVIGYCYQEYPGNTNNRC